MPYRIHDCSGVFRPLFCQTMHVSLYHKSEEPSKFHFVVLFRYNIVRMPV